MEEFERMLSATKYVTARRPPVSRSTYQKEVPVHKLDDLFRYLGVDPDKVKALQEAGKVVQAEVTDDMWEAFLDGDGDAEWLDAEPEYVQTTMEANGDIAGAWG